MPKTFTLTLTGDEMITVRAALAFHVAQRLLEIDQAEADKELGIANFLSHQMDRAKLVYAKVFYQHEDQCVA